MSYILSSRSAPLLLAVYFSEHASVFIMLAASAAIIVMLAINGSELRFRSEGFVVAEAQVRSMFTVGQEPLTRCTLEGLMFTTPVRHKAITLRGLETLDRTEFVGPDIVGSVDVIGGRVRAIRAYPRLGRWARYSLILENRCKEMRSS